MPVQITREDLAGCLRGYEEDELAEQVLAVDDETLSRVYDRADQYATSDEFATPSGAGMLLHKAVSLAAVDVIEGESRPLRRTKWDQKRARGG